MKKKNLKNLRGPFQNLKIYFSKSNFHCKHNIHYWEIDPYLGFGPSAHSFDIKYRWNNTKNLDSYLQKIRSNKTIISKIELLSEENKVNEIIGFGIRMFKGIDLNKLPKLYRKKLEEKLLLAKNKYRNCFIYGNNHIRLSEKGMLFADQITIDLMV